MNTQLIQMRANARWNRSLSNIIALAAFYSKKQTLNMIEVGSYQGESAEIFCQTGLVSSIWCIDPWQPGYDDADEASSTNMQLVQQAFDMRMAKWKQMHKFVGTLDTFVRSNIFADINGSIDLIYIDGLHTYKQVKNDIQLAKTIVKPNIAYAGHDFYKGWPDVVQAVQEEFHQPDVVFLDTSWMVFS